MKKRMLAYLLAMIMVLCTFNVFAYDPAEYLPGEIEYFQKLDNPSSAANAVCSDSSVKINAGGSVKYEFILPFDAATLDITYSASAATTLTLKTPRNSYTASLSAGNSTYQLTLTPEHLGVTSMEISATEAVTISQLKYIKTKTEIVRSIVNSEGKTAYVDVVEYTEYQEHLKTAVIVSEKSSAIKVRNLTRYINFEDTKETTTLIDGKMYLPIETFARAFSLYYEDYTDLMYAYISGEDFAIYLKPGDSYYESRGVKSSFEDIAVYKNGITYVPVRNLAEMLGYTVYYRDGLAVIDNKIAANEILNNYDVFEELKAELKAYEPVFDEENPGTVYHVAQTAEANDFGDGTEDVPFATIQKAADVARAGDTVIIHEGVYNEKVTGKHNGTAAKPIIFKAADGENVTLSAFKTVSGFIPYTNPANNVSMYVTDLRDLEFECALPGAWDVDRNFVLYNDDVLAEGRHPNEKTSTAKTVTRKNETLDETTNPEQTETMNYAVTPDLNPSYPDINNHKLLPILGDLRIRDVLRKGESKRYDHTLYSEVDLNQDTEDYWKGATFIGRVGMAWNLSAGLVTASKLNEATVSERCFSGIPNGTITYFEDKKAEDFGFLTHHLNTVDKAGEWYIDVDNKKMYVIPPENANPDTMEFEVKERQVLFDMRGKNYIQLHNVNTRGGGITMAECTGCILDGGTHKYISQLDLSSAHCLRTLDTIYARYDTLIDDYKFGNDGKYFMKTSLLGETGFVVTGHNNAIVNTDIEYSATAGIMVDGSYNYIENNYISKTGYGVTFHGGINLEATRTDEGYPAGGHQIYQNKVIGTGRACIGASGGTVAPWDIAFNDLGWANTGALDTGVFYFNGVIGGTELTPTTIHHNIMHDNVMSKIGSAMQTVFYSDGHTLLSDIYNNIFYLSSDDPTYVHKDRDLRYQALEFWQTGSVGAFQRHWGNTQKIFESPDKVKFDAKDYPNGYPFYAGALRDDVHRFMMNYNRDGERYVINLGNEEINNGAYIGSDNTVILPQQNSNVLVDDINLDEKGAKIDIIYSGDKYANDMKNLPEVIIELINSNGTTVGTFKKPLKRFSDYPDVLSYITMHIPEGYNECTALKLSSTSADIGFAKMILSDFDIEEENKKVEIPYDADMIIMGSADFIDVKYGHTAIGVLTYDDEFRVDMDRYLSLKPTYHHGARYDNRKILNTCTKISLEAITNYNNHRTKATVYLGTGENGEKIAEIDYIGAWKEGDMNSPRILTANLLRTLEPGTYTFYIRWADGGTSEVTKMYLY